MKTLVVTSSWPRSGDELAGTFVRTDALSRAREGHGVIVAAPAGPGIARGGEGLVVVDVPHGGLFGSPGAAQRAIDAPWRVLGIVPFARALHELVERTRPEAIVAHWLLPAGLVVDDVLRRSRSFAPHVELVAHGADVRLLSALPRPLARAVVERIARRASCVRAVSPGLAARLVEIAPILARTIVVAPMPLATDDAVTRRQVGLRAAELGRERGTATLHVVASRLIASKRIDRAIDHVAERGGRLVLVGAGPMRAQLIEHARRRNVDASFVGAKPHEEALAWLAAADVVLAPLSSDEGAPTVVREALSLGRRVLTFGN